MLKIKALLPLLFFMFCVASIARADDQKTYTVKSGDTLSKICYKFAENGTRKTYTKEAERLGVKNPNLIYPGQVLNFPKLYRVAWESSWAGGIAGHGRWHPGKTIVQMWVEYGNHNYPFLTYRVEAKEKK